VTVVSRLRAGRPGFEPTQPPIPWAPASLLPGVNRQVREADHSSPFIAEVENAWKYASIPPIHLHGLGMY